MIERSELDPSDAGPLLRIDEKLLSAAIWEVRVAHDTRGSLCPGDGSMPKNGQTFFLAILLELMFPGIHSDHVQRLLRQFAIYPMLTQSAETRYFEKQLL